MITRQNIALLLLAVFLAVVPLAIHAEFAGTDDAATEAITEIRPDYKPWFNSLWEPSEEMEQILFALQAAGGAAFIAYFAWRHRRPRPSL